MKAAKMSKEPAILAAFRDYVDWMSSSESDWATEIELAKMKGEEIGLEKGEKIGLTKGEKIGIEKGEKIGIEKAEAIGINKVRQEAYEEKVEILKNLLKMGMEEEKILEATGLGKKELEKARGEIKAKTDSNNDFA